MKICLSAILIGLLYLIGNNISFAEDEIDKALEARTQGFPQVTIVKLSHLLTHLPSNDSKKVRALRELGQTYFEAGQLGDALHILRLHALSSDLVARFWLAQSFAAQGEFAQALPLYKEVLANTQLQPYATLGVIRMLHALGKNNEALETITNVPEDSPVVDEVILEHVNILLDLHRLNDAAALLKSNPKVSTSPWGQYFTARITMMEKQWNSAATILANIHPDNNELMGDILLARSECLIQSSDLSSAENILRKFIQENPQHPALPIVFAKLNEVYDRENGPSSVDLRRWIEDANDPFRAEYARFYYACNDLRIGRSENAIRLFREFIRDLPYHPLVNAARLMVAQQYLNTGKAENALEVLTGFQPNLPGAREIKKDIDFLRGRALFALNRYAEAANTFLTAAHEDPTPLAEIILYDAALSHLLASIHTVNLAQLELMRRYPKGPGIQELNLIEALQKAKQKRPDAIKALDNIADTSVRARLALAELYLASNDRKQAADQWNQLANNNTNNSSSDRIAYLAVFLADNGDKDADERVIRLARDFLEAYPRSPFRAEVRMKLGEAYFRRGNFLGARIQFESLAREFPDSPLTEPALFFAGQSSVRMMDASGLENAMLTFEEVAKMGGPFALRARLEQAQLQQNAGHLDQALLILKNILSSKPDADIRFEALMMQGNIFFNQGIISPENYTRAITSWQQISSDPKITLPWKNQALTKMGAAYQKLGNMDQALASYYDVFNAFNPSHPEFFWFYKAGFDAGKLLESRQLWKESMNVYKKIASIPGPRSQEAKDRIKYLESEHLIQNK